MPVSGTSQLFGSRCVRLRGGVPITSIKVGLLGRASVCSRFSTMPVCQKAASRLRLSRFAKSAGRARRCAIPGCSARGAAARCCGQRICVLCVAHTLRTSLDLRLRTRCPYCRKTMLVPMSVVRQLMIRAYPSHAAIIESDGPPAVVAHFPCNDGHFNCRASPVRVLSIAQQRQIDSMREHLDRAHRKIAQLTPALTQPPCSLGGRRGRNLFSPEKKAKRCAWLLLSQRPAVKARRVARGRAQFVRGAALLWSILPRRAG